MGFGTLAMKFLLTVWPSEKAQAEQPEQKRPRRSDRQRRHIPKRVTQERIVSLLSDGTPRTAKEMNVAIGGRRCSNYVNEMVAAGMICRIPAPKRKGSSGRPTARYTLPEQERAS